DLIGPAPDEETEQWRSRVFGHRVSLSAPSLAAQAPEHRWVAADELAEMAEQGCLECGEQVGKWLHMWQAEEDADGQPVTRSFGVPTTDVEYYSYNRNGNAQGTYRVGVFDENGKPTPAGALT
ncbi:MAG: hypothetical protein K0U93_21900, partial [Gammaproteobacteria bacterium]|nr:hypothetical protein [Gammaproteobacteria bacterium]